MSNGKELNEKRLSAKNIVLGIMFAAAFCVVQFLLCSKYDGVMGCIYDGFAILLLILCCENLIPKVRFKSSAAAVKTDAASHTAAAVIVLATMLMTIFAGTLYFGEKRYYITCALVMLEAIVLYIIAQAERRPAAVEFMLVGALFVTAVASRGVFLPLRQLEPMAAVVIVAGVCLGGEAGLLIGAAAAFVSGILFGQGIQAAWQMIAFGIIGLLAGELFFQDARVKRTRLRLCVFGFAATFVVYGVIVNTSAVLLWQTKVSAKMLISAYRAYLPYDIVHALSTVFFLNAAAEPMCECAARIRARLGNKM